MKRYLGLVLALVVMVALGLGSSVGADTTPAPMSGGGAVPYICPLCGNLLVFGTEVKFVKTNDSLWGFERMDTQIKCSKCGYSNGKDGRGNLITPVTAIMQFEWGAKSWPINKK